MVLLTFTEFYLYGQVRLGQKTIGELEKIELKVDRERLPEMEEAPEMKV